MGKIREGIKNNKKTIAGVSGIGAVIITLITWLQSYTDNQQKAVLQQLAITEQQVKNQHFKDSVQFTTVQTIKHYEDSVEFANLRRKDSIRTARKEHRDSIHHAQQEVWQNNKDDYYDCIIEELKKEKNCN